MSESTTPRGRAALRRHGIKPVKVAVAREFLRASRGQKFSELPAHHSGVHAATAGKSL